MSEYKFAVFILSHGRANRVLTLKTLRQQGYTGKVYLVIDNEDKSRAEYETLGEDVIVFDKLDIANRYDTGDNFSERRSVFFARNASFEIARNLGLDYFLELDDDYSSFYYRFTANLNRAQRSCYQLDKVFHSMIKYLRNTKALTIAFAQGGDLIGGYLNFHVRAIRLKRKAMNTFFCAVDRPFEFTGRVNEDVNTYITLGNRGNLIFTTFLLSINQGSTQESSGGMTELYKQEGTYIKTFYTLMHAPSCVKVYSFGVTHKRLHHKIKWTNAVPQIISEQHVKRLQH